MKRFWFDYTAVGNCNQFFSPLVHARLLTTNSTSVGLQFICDTGAVTSWANMASFSRLFPVEYAQYKNNLSPSGILDANGQPLRGYKKKVTISIPLSSNSNQTISFNEDVYFGNVRFNLLGQTAFEKVGGHFHNFPSSSKGRKFALFTNNL